MSEESQVGRQRRSTASGPGMNIAEQQRHCQCHYSCEIEHFKVELSVVSIGIKVRLETRLTDESSSVVEKVGLVSPAGWSGKYRRFGGRDEDQSSSMCKYFS